ncbi:MAG: sugar ABC transporter permease [Candidatus Limiplasma sp.]|nr:sugar ABC transporter permease [Candidatus Limiplasma sp.]
MVQEKQRRNPGQRSDERWAYAFISPMLIGYALFVLLPIVATFVISGTDWSLIRAPRMIGLENYKTLVSDTTFHASVINTLYFAALLLPSNLIVCLGLASLLKDKFPGVGFFRTAVFTPVVTSVVVWGIIWKYIFQTDNGIINILLRMVGVQGPQWLFSTSLAIPIVAFVTLVKGLGMNMVILIGAMKDVPQMYYEAADLDGASKWRQFRSITMPMIAPSVFLVMIMTVIGSLKVFGQIYTLTGGGPGNSSYVFVYYIYQQAFQFYEFGYASSISAILFIIILILTLAQWNIRKRWIYHEG